MKKLHFVIEVECY